jgi:hypothetical protein
LGPRVRRGFQSKLGVYSSKHFNLHHSPHNGHLKKKIKKGTIFFGHDVFFYLAIHARPPIIYLCIVLSQLVLFDERCSLHYFSVCNAAAWCWSPVLFLIISVTTLFSAGRAMALWLRHYATNSQVAGLIPVVVIGIFQWHNPSGRIMALGLTQPLTEMSNRCILNLFFFPLIRYFVAWHISMHESRTVLS